MLQPKKTKICLVGDCLSGGGAERVHAFLSDYFSAKGIEVHNVVVQDRVTYDFSGGLLNLGLLKDDKNGFSNKLKRFKVLRNFIKEHQFDYIIDFRMRRKTLQDLLISRFIYSRPAIFTVHHYIIDWYMPAASWLTQLMYGNAYGIISITLKMKKDIERRHSLKNVKNIYNPVNIAYIDNRLEEQGQDTGYRYILAAGSMGDDYIKQFDKLMEAYAASVLPGAGIKLVIIGQGSRKTALQELSEKMGLKEKVIFKGFQENPYVYMRNALFFVLSSKYEGLPMVMLESLACGTPVVSFDCFTGPSEIIVHEENGLLIEDQNMQELTKGMNVMYEDKELYERCRQNAKSSIAKFSLDKIGDQWMEFLKIQNQN